MTRPARPIRSRTRILGCRLATAALLGGALAGCGAEKAAAPAATAAATATPVATDPAAGRVALTYVRAIMANDYDAALPLVVANQREVLKALALGQGPGTLPKVTADVTVGEVRVDGARASVSILGRLCRTDARRDARPQCIENHDPDTESPLFRVSLVRERGWKVMYDFAAASGQG